MTGESISDAYPVRRPIRQVPGSSEIHQQGRGSLCRRHPRRSTKTTSRPAGRGRLAIVLDGKLYSAPTVRTEIRGGSAEITGSFTQREAIDLANVLNNPLDLPLEVVKIVRGRSVAGARMRSPAASGRPHRRRAGRRLHDRLLHDRRLIALFAPDTQYPHRARRRWRSFGATLTLPGIAGIVLTVGMAVDANILIFERMREELMAGKCAPAAVSSGFDKVFSTIVDANLTTLITSGVMIWLGTGPVKGFGVTLAIGIFSTIFSSLMVSQMLLDIIVGRGLDEEDADDSRS